MKKGGIRISLAKNAGFCSGVRRAVERAIATARDNPGKVYMLGDIVHNEFVVESLKNEGIKVIKEIDEVKDGIILIRAHGESPKVYEQAKKRGLKIVDATCPLVLEIQQIAVKMENEGKKVVIIGDKEHDEVIAISERLNHPIIISHPSEVVGKIPDRKLKLGIVIQSTQDIENVQQIVSEIIPRARELTLYNTICHPSRSHQREIRQMPKNNDLMIIIGSFTSANTKRLTSISRSINPRTYQIESAKDLDPKWFKGIKSVGITAGASTPDEVINQVLSRVKEIVNAC